MEGINLEKRVPAVEGDMSSETRGEKIEGAEIRVREMFDKKMEARGTTIDRIRENPSFSGPEERGF